MKTQEPNTISKPEEEIRLDKLSYLINSGIDPYPSEVKRSHTIGDLLKKFGDMESAGTEVTVVGRIRSIRAHGASTFSHMEDGSGKIQIYFKKDDLGNEKYDLFDKLFDVADFIQVSGVPFTTKRGEASLKVTDFSMLSKAVLPLPDKHHGLKNEDDRYRKRYLDILTNPEVKEMFIKKSKFWGAIRRFLVQNDFLEVETPVLETLTGGADARPFITHHNALDIDVYLRISVGELWQKRLMVAGYEKTFEIGRVFRNEGMDADHLQDYTAMEFYWSYADWKDGMKFVEEMIKHAAMEAFGTLTFDIKGHSVDLSKPWDKYDYREEILNRTGVDIGKTSVKELKNKLNDLGVAHDDFDNLPRGIDQLWKYCRRQISGPGYLIYPPKSVSPLAKESKERPGYVEQYQLILGGSEQCKGYSELNNPIDQESRFIEQQSLRDAGDDEAQMHDHDFVEALKHGMPPTTGLGISERLFSVLADKPVRETQIFPLMKPKNTH